MTTQHQRADAALYDPLDVALRRAQQTAGLESAPLEGPPRPWSRGIYGVVLLLIGVALGPVGLGILTPRVLSLLDPAIPVALGALGVLFALASAATLSRERYLVSAAAIEALVTTFAVGLATYAVATAVAPDSPVSTWEFALFAGICAAASSALSGVEGRTSQPAGARLADLDALVPILLAAVMVAVIGRPTLASGLLLLLQSAGAALLIAVAAWLLMARSTSDIEQRVFGIATLLLLGGIADYLSVSALLTGAIAGTFWHLTGGATRERLRVDVGRLQHPLVALLLIVAGAHAQVAPGLMVLAVIYILVRAAAKLTAGRGVAALVGTSAPVGPYLVTSGVFGIALALDVSPTPSAGGNALLALTVIGTIGSQLLAGNPQRTDVE